MGTEYTENDEWGHHAEVPEEQSNYEFIETTGEEEKSPSGTMSSSQFREMANCHYAHADFDTALPLYTAALEAFEIEKLNEDVNEQDDDEKYIDLKVIHLCNRATCLFRMEMYEESRADALEAVKVSNGEFQKRKYHGTTFKKIIFYLILKQIRIFEYLH
jgi:tetratricopeptide (TPR) repeat protein